jgi:hypothetical protein
MAAPIYSNRLIQLLREADCSTMAHPRLRLIHCIAIAAVALLSTQSLGQVCIIQAPANYTFIDMGYDPETNEVGIVGTITIDDDQLASIFELNETRDGFTSQTLADLPNSVGNNVSRSLTISADASRIAGVTLQSPNTVNLEGLTWLRSDPSSPVGIGTLPVTGVRAVSQAHAAWSGGVAGTVGGQARPIRWDEVNGIQELENFQRISFVDDVSANADIIVGFSAHEVFDGAAYCWERQGDSYSIHRLDDSIEGHTLFQSRARAVSPNGNFIAGEITAFDAQGNFAVFPVVWEGAERTLRVLTDSNGNFAQGTVTDVSDLGFSAGTTFNQGADLLGFVWSPEFDNGIMIFEDWLAEQDPEVTPPFQSFIVSAVADANGRALFIASGDVGQVALIDVTLESPGMMPIPDGLGDFNDDGSVDLSDLDMYSGNLGADAIGALAALDLDADGTVDVDDFEFHYSSLVETSNDRRGTFAGDANLDGSVDVLNDAFTLVSNLGQPASSFSQGDFNADGVVDVLGDAFALVANLGMTNQSSTICGQ